MHYALDVASMSRCTPSNGDISSSRYCSIIELDVFFILKDTFCYMVYITQLHTLKCNDSEKAVTAFPRWHPNVKHRANAGKPSFQQSKYLRKTPSGHCLVMPLVFTANSPISFGD